MRSHTTATEMFDKYLLPTYRFEDLVRRPFTGVYPDSFELETEQRSLLSDTEERLRLLQKINELTISGVNDFQSVCMVRDGLSINAARAIDDCFNQKLISEVIDRSDPATKDNEYCCLVAELGAYLGETLIHYTEAEWFLDWPIWDCCVRHQSFFFPVFHWSLKRISFDADLVAPKLEWAVSLLQTD